MRWLARTFLVFVLALLFIPLLTYAQTAPPPAASAPNDSVPSGPFGCLPKVNALAAIGTGQGIKEFENGWGYSWAWWCPAEFTWRKNSYAQFHSYKPTVELITKWSVALQQPDALSAFNKLLADGTVIPTKQNERDELANLHAKARKKLDESRPADPAYRSGAATNDAGTRPAFDVVNSARVQPSSGTAPANTACRCAVLAIKETSLWCPWQGGPDTKVTLCRKVE